MNFTNELKGKLENAGSEEKVKEILNETKKSAKNVGIILSDEDLDMASGGVNLSKNYNAQKDEFQKGFNADTRTWPK
ncbi:MAG: hypothetical protein K6F99_08220 [Lachnospiraceae bacterium]|nr:hypothetical protein [Lachnospiraceae bacterium]